MELRVRRVVVRVSLVVVKEREIVVNVRSNKVDVRVWVGGEDVRGGGRDAEERVGGWFDGT